VATAIKRISAANKLQALQSPSLKAIPWLMHGFSTRHGGATSCYGGRSLNLGFTKDDFRQNVEKNRKHFLLALGAETQRKPWPLTALHQVHSDLIHVLQSPAESPLTGDGLITNRPGMALGVMTADCLPHRGKRPGDHAA